jgi:hypothetical protein
MLLLMNGLTTNMHPITRIRGFTQISFIVKMHLDLIKSKVVQKNLVLFGEFELVLGLPQLLSILEVVRTLIKFV